MAHDTYIRGSDRIDLCLSREDRRVVVSTSFRLVEGRWTQARLAVRSTPKATEGEARFLMGESARNLTDDGYVLTMGADRPPEALELAEAKLEIRRLERVVLDRAETNTERDRLLFDQLHREIDQGMEWTQAARIYRVATGVTLRAVRDLFRPAEKW
jgi:hypothetical protein